MLSVLLGLGRMMGFARASTGTLLLCFQQHAADRRGKLSSLLSLGGKLKTKDL